MITKKIKDHKASAEGGEQEHDPADSAMETPPSKTKAKPGRKRKAALENQDDDGDEGEAPAPKKRGGGKKAVAETSETASELISQVKPEPDDNGTCSITSSYSDCANEREVGEKSFLI